MTKIEQCSKWGTKAWENIHNKNKGVRDFPYEEQRPGNFLTHLSHWASQQNMPFKEWQNLLEVPITSQHTYCSSSHPLLFHIFFFFMPGSSCQCVNTTQRAIEFNREASPLIFNQNQYKVSCLIIGWHSGHWGTFQAGICWEYVLTRLKIPTLIQQGKSLDYQLYIMRFPSDFPMIIPSQIHVE